MFCDVITAKFSHDNYFVRAYNLAGCGQNADMGVPNNTARPRLY